MKAPHQYTRCRSEKVFKAKCKKCGYIGNYPNRPSRCPHCGGKVKVAHSSDRHTL